MDKFRIKVFRNDEENISFFLLGVSLQCKNMSLCPDYIKNELKPRKFHYQYDFFDSFEEGYFIKDNIHVKIHWSIYKDYDFEIDKYATNDQIEKVKLWVEQIFQYLINNKSVEKKYYDFKNFNDEDIIPFEKPQKTILDKLKSLFQI